ncbi:tautomerase family protein [Auraticoccus sp. F435]|uniref:Tautomerase family protein n=1 Tax=Auraticoccus cholistanensis TaxID=2656650 RepID=A0A6A9V280_9ACTN|nr:tautomerase family protein [Auraticoccus cholistanensis]
MAQVVVTGLAGTLEPRVPALSEAIHAAAQEAFGLPAEKRFHRFVPLPRELFLHPRGEDYTIIEVSMFTGRTTQAKKAFVAAVYRRTAALGLAAEDVEITITETPRENWGIRGVPGDELELGYRVDV